MTHSTVPQVAVAIVGLSMIFVIGVGAAVGYGHTGTGTDTELGPPALAQVNESPAPNASGYGKLWSGDKDGIRTNRDNESLAVGDTTWSNPPPLAEQWNDAGIQKVNTSSVVSYGIGNISRTSRSVNDSNTSQWSVAPSDATLKQGDLIRDAYVNVHSVSPSIRYHLSDGTTTVTRPSGTIRVLTDLGVNATGNITVREVSVDNVTVTDETDGERLARVENTGTGAVSLDYEGFDAGHEGMEVAANLSVTYSEANETNATRETVRVTDGVDMLSYSPKEANATANTFPNNTSTLDVNAGTPFWDRINMSGNRTVKNVWGYYTKAEPGKKIVARNGTKTELQGTARAAQVHAYPAREKPTFVSDEGGGSVTMTGDGESAPSLGENINVDGPNPDTSVNIDSEVRVNVQGDDPPESVSVESEIGDEPRDVSLSEGDNTYKEADLSVEVLGENDDAGTKTVLVNLTDAETGEGIGTLGTGRAGNVTVSGETVETNASGMATVEIPRNASVKASYEPGDRPGDELYLREKSVGATGDRGESDIEFADLLQGVVDFSPAVVPMLLIAFLCDRAGIMRSWPPWELLR